jgi:hypothetical protein
MSSAGSHIGGKFPAGAYRQAFGLISGLSPVVGKRTESPLKARCVRPVASAGRAEPPWTAVDAPRHSGKRAPGEREAPSARQALVLGEDGGFDATASVRSGSGRLARGWSGTVSTVIGIWFWHRFGVLLVISAA